MSWSVNLVGTPFGISKELDLISEKLDGQSKKEFDEAKPHLQGLLNQMVNQNVRLNANGHATFTNDEKTYGNISVVLESFYGGWCE